MMYAVHAKLEAASIVSEDWDYSADPSFPHRVHVNTVQLKRALPHQSKDRFLRIAAMSPLSDTRYRIYLTVEGRAALTGTYYIAEYTAIAASLRRDFCQDYDLPLRREAIMAMKERKTS